MNKIISIEEIEKDEMEGYEIKTDKYSLSILIDKCQCCCEEWGYVCSEDDIDGYIGSNLVSYAATDTALNNKTNIDIYEGDIMFLTLETSNGSLQFAVYNEHNGYYGHNAIIKRDEKVIDECCL